MSRRINKAEVLQMTGVSETDMRSATFPRPVMIGGELFWFASEVVAWLALPRGSRKHWSARG